MLHRTHRESRAFPESWRFSFLTELPARSVCIGASLPHLLQQWVEQMPLVSYFFVTLTDPVLIWSHALWNGPWCKWARDFIKIKGVGETASACLKWAVASLWLPLTTFMVVYSFRIPAWCVPTAFLITLLGRESEGKSETYYHSKQLLPL